MTTKFVLLNVVIVLVAITCTTVFALIRINKEIYRQANVAQENRLMTFWELLRTKGDNFRIVDGKLLAGSYVINNNFELPDKIKKIFGGTATIFMGDTRVSTNVATADGHRAIGTKLTGAAYDAIFKEGKSYRGETNILDIPYFTAYDPIKNSKGEIIGVLYVGVKKSDFFAANDHLITGVIVMAVTLACVLLAVAGLLVHRSLAPIKEMVTVVADLTTKVTNHVVTIEEAVDQQVGFATQLSSSVTEISSTMEEFSSTAVQIAGHSQEVVAIADRTLLGNRNGAAGVETLTGKMNDICRDNENNLLEIIELGQKSKEITKIMEIIGNIANQTKLIAFNAALEAASAGESGKRFGVVAVEIKRLADSVAESASMTEGKITEIMNAVNRLVITSEKGSQGILEGMGMLGDVVAGATATSDSAKQISLSTQQQQLASSQVVLSLQDIQDGARHSSASIQQINTISKDLAAMSNDLKVVMERFMLDTASKI